MGKTVVATAIQRHWVHSHEEDTETESVYRPASYVFPPSRGRKSFEIKPSGKLIEHPIGPSDRSEETPGTWKLGDDDTTLTFYPEASSKPARVMRIASVDKEKLVIRK
jgi:hypothetical protein